MSSEWRVPPPICCFSIDVLTDGSEYTGDRAALFLSLWKTATRSTTDDTAVEASKSNLSSSADNNDASSSSVLLARYAISGCSGDGWSRAAADQRYKLGPVRAVFSPIPMIADNEEDDAVGAMAALPALLYASQQETLTVVLPACSSYSSPHQIATTTENKHTSRSVQEWVEQIVHTVHSSTLLYPKVRICSFPPTTQTPSLPSHHQQQPQEWWKVYDDNHILVHAQLFFHHPVPRNGLPSLPLSPSAAATPPSSQHQNSSRAVLVVYLYTFHALLQQQSSALIHHHDKNSLLLFPESASLDAIHSFLDRKPELPIVADSSSPLSLLTTILIIQQPQESGRYPTTKLASGSQPDSSYSSCHILTTARDQNRIDPRLFVRAQRQTLSWRESLCHSSNNGIPPPLQRHFPFSSSPSSSSPSITRKAEIDGVGTGETGDESCSSHHPILLQSGSSILFEISATTGPGRTPCRINVSVLDRNAEREQRVSRENSTNRSSGSNATSESQSTFEEAATASNSDRCTWPHRMKDFLSFHSVDKVWPVELEAGQHHDENEIILDDEDEDSLDRQHGVDRQTATQPINCKPEMQPMPELLILGTGCASPSPFRGASGYALIFPRPTATLSDQTIVFAIDVGEGFCTQWNRYAGDRPLACISHIWVSHAHWDHYGGLVNLLIQIYRDKRRRGVFTAQGHEELNAHNKRPRSMSKENHDSNFPFISFPPWVVATPKVLRFLSLMFQTNSDKYFRPVHHDDAATMTLALAKIQPIMFWENIRVDHSCLAYGFVLGLRYDDRAPFVFCYSGDTRPCSRLVQACRRLCATYRTGGRVDFLLHEATFDENEKHMSLAKMHSTVQGAVSIARAVDARRVMLTHFSQRYDAVPAIKEESLKYNSRMQVGFALDGMSVVLFDR